MRPTPGDAEKSIVFDLHISYEYEMPQRHEMMVGTYGGGNTGFGEEAGKGRGR